jgi:hypothetical protein
MSSLIFGLQIDFDEGVSKIVRHGNVVAESAREQIADRIASLEVCCVILSVYLDYFLPIFHLHALLFAAQTLLFGRLCSFLWTFISLAAFCADFWDGLFFLPCCVHFWPQQTSTPRAKPQSFDEALQTLSGPRERRVKNYAALLVKPRDSTSPNHASTASTGAGAVSEAGDASSMDNMLMDESQQHQHQQSDARPSDAQGQNQSGRVQMNVEEASVQNE